MLAEAVCKLEGFTYAPSDSVYWQHGNSTERDFIYVTTQHLNHEQLQLQLPKEFVLAQDPPRVVAFELVPVDFGPKSPGSLTPSN